MAHEVSDVTSFALPILQAQRPTVRRNTFGDNKNNLSSKQPQQVFQDESKKHNTVNPKSPLFDGKIQVMNRIMAATSSSPRNSKIVLSQQHQYHLHPEAPLSARSKEEQVYSSALAVSRSSVAVSVTNDHGGRNSQKMVV